MTPPHTDQIVCLLNSRMARIRAATFDDMPHMSRLPGVSSHASALVAETLDGRVLGCAAYKRLAGPWAEADFAVAGDYAGTGLARALVVALVRAAEREGVNVLVAPLRPEQRDVVEALRDEVVVRERPTGVQLFRHHPAELRTVDQEPARLAA